MIHEIASSPEALVEQSAAEDERYFLYSLANKVEIPDDTTRIKVDASVHELPDNAFNNRRNLIEVKLPDGLIKIGFNAFKNCSGLKHIEIPKSVKVISDCAFDGCSSLPFLNLYEARITKLSKRAFADCYNLRKIILPCTLTRIEEQAFHLCSQLMSCQVTGSSLVAIGECAFECCELLQNFSLSKMEESEVSIHATAFAGCDCLFEVGEGGSLRTISPIEKILLTRFDGLPNHQLCYSQALTDSETLAKAVKKNTEKEKECTDLYRHCDVYQMTALHVNVMSANPSLDVCKVLVETYPQDLLATNIWGDTPLSIACVCHAPLCIIQTLVQAQMDNFCDEPDWISLVHESDSIDTVQYLIKMSISKHLNELGLDEWKNTLLNEINEIGTLFAENNTMIHYNRNEHTVKRQIIDGMVRVCLRLKHFIRKESLSLLELAIWKSKLISSQSNSNRETCRVQCGADIIIQNALPFLDLIDE